MVALFSVPVYHTTSLPYEVPAPAPIEVEEEKKIEPIEIDTEMLCNCYLGAKTISGAELPRMADIHPNVEKPEVGDIAIMMYDTVKHLAVVTEVSTSTWKTLETNYHRCAKSERTLGYDYKRLVGFYRPSVNK